MCFVGKANTAFVTKDAISGIRVSPGSAETLFTQGGKIKHHLIAYLSPQRFYQTLSKLVDVYSRLEL